MEVEKLLRIKTSLTKTDEEALDQIKEKIKIAIPLPVKAQEFIIPILNLLYDGYNINSIKFIEKVFFEFHILIKSTKPHNERIYNELKNIENYKEDSLEEQTHQINIYRNIVSDLFDPYINILVAIFQFIEGTFVSIHQTNLGLGERNKYEFAFNRLKPTDLFIGYNPIVRNAISHTGTEGIIYQANSIVFRNIKRGASPVIEFVEWTNEELREKTLQLLFLIHAIDISMEIFGFDVSEIILRDEKLSHKFLDEILNTDQRLEIQANFDLQIKKVLENKRLNQKDKLDFLSNFYFLECGKRNMPVSSVGFNDEKKLLGINIPLSRININEESEIITRSLELVRYGIIAIALFKHYFTDYLIKEIKEEDKDFLAIKVRGKDLEDYGNEKAGLYDLLCDNTLFINGERATVTVDFEALKNIENKSFGRRFPKKKR